MATSGKRISAVGATLAYSTTQTGTYTPVVGLRGIKLLGMTVGDAKTTDLGATDGIHTYDPGWIEPGEIQCSVFVDDAARVALMTILRSRTKYWWKVVVPGAGGTTTQMSDTVEGYIKELNVDQRDVESNEYLYGALTIKTSGPPTLVTAA